MVNMNKKQYFTMAWTWGIIMTLVGYIVGLGMLITGHKPTRKGYCWYYTVKNFDGITLGNVIIVGKNASDYVKAHEHGHAIQNAVYGPFMVVIGLMSLVRATYRKIRKKIGKPCTTDYYSIWFEKEASDWGLEFGERNDITW